MSSPYFSSTLYDCAMECASLRRKRKCKNDFGDPICSKCKFNINRYINADPRQVELIMLRAESNVEDIKASFWPVRIIFIIFIVFCLLQALHNYRWEKERDARLMQQRRGQTDVTFLITQAANPKKNLTTCKWSGNQLTG